MKSAMTRWSATCFAAGLFAATAGCGSDAPPPRKIDQAQSAQQSATYTGDLLRQLGQAIRFESGDDGLIARLLGRFAGGQPRRISPVPAPLPLPLLDQLSHTPALKSFRPSIFSLVVTQEESFDDTAADLEALLRDRLFVAGNVEADTGTEVTYLLKGDPTCRPLPSRILEGAADQVDAGCAEDLAKLQVRIVVRADGDGYRFQIQLGPDRRELSVFVIHSDLLGWEADLLQARQAGDFARQALMQPEEAMPFSKLQGRVKFAVQKLGEDAVRFTFGVLAALDIQGKADEPLAINLGKADPAVALTADGKAEQMTLDLAWPTTDVRAPWDPRDMGANATKNTDLHVSIGGLTGKTALSGAAEQITFTGAGFGPSFVAVRNSRIVELNLNPNHGRKLDLTVKVLPGDEARFEVSPRLDLSVAWKFNAIAADLDEVPDYLADETWALRLEGATPVVVETIPRTTAGFAGGFKLTGGTLSLSSTAAPAATVNVPMGKCLSENPMPPTDGHPLLGSLAAVDCP